MEETKSLEFYFDSKTFTKELLLKNLEEVQKDFPKKEMRPKLYKNKFGTYVLKIYFLDKNNYFTKIKEKMNFRRNLLVSEKSDRVRKKVEIRQKKDLQKITKKKENIYRKLKIEEQKKIKELEKFQRKLEKEKQNKEKIKQKGYERKLKSMNNVEQIYNTKLYGQYKNTGTYRPI